MDFLEFLGEGIVIEDEYLDPLNYADIEQSDTELNYNRPARLNIPTSDKNEEVKNNEK